MFQRAGGLILATVMMLVVVMEVRVVPVLLVFCPHLSQSLSPADDLQQMETGFLAPIPH